MSDTLPDRSGWPVSPDRSNRGMTALLGPWCIGRWTMDEFNDWLLCVR